MIRLEFLPEVKEHVNISQFQTANLLLSLSYFNFLLIAQEYYLNESYKENANLNLFNCLVHFVQFVISQI